MPTLAINVATIEGATTDTVTIWPVWGEDPHRVGQGQLVGGLAYEGSPVQSQGNPIMVELPSSASIGGALYTIQFHAGPTWTGVVMPDGNAILTRDLISAVPPPGAGGVRPSDLEASNDPALGDAALVGPDDEFVFGAGGGGGGGGADAVARAAAAAAQATANQAQAGATAALDRTNVYVGPWGNLTDEQKAALDLGQVSLRYNRYWIVHERDNARANGPLDAEPDGWRAIDGQYRTDAPAQPRNYDAGDHTQVLGNLYFCRIPGAYTAVEITVSDGWWNLSGGGGGGGGGDVTAAQLAAEAQARQQGDTALGARIDGLPEGVTAAQLQAEVVARGEGDNALGGRIDGLPDTNAQFAEEALQRSQADVALGQRIDNLPEGGVTPQAAEAIARMVTAVWGQADNDEQIPANKLANAVAGTARTEVLVPFRPGSDATKILIQSIGYVTVADGYTEYGAPRYIADSGFTLAVVEAHDFANEPHFVSLLSGGGAPAAGPIVSGDNPTIDESVSGNLIWEPTQKRFSRVLGHSAVTQAVDWGENALPPGYVFEAGKTYIGIAESRTDLPQVLPEMSVWFLRNSNTFTTGDGTGHAEQYVPPGDLGAFGFKDAASNAVTALNQIAAFADPDTGNLQVFPWRVHSFTPREPSEWHVDPYVTQSLLPDRPFAEPLGDLIFPSVAMINGRAYRFADFTSDDLVDADTWWVEFRGASGKSGTSGTYSGRFWGEKPGATFTTTSSGDISGSFVPTGMSTSFLTGRGTASATNATGGLNTAFYIYKRLEMMWIACPHWTSLFGSLQEADRVMRIMRRR